MAACAPNRNQRMPSRAKARWRSASSSAIGSVEEGTRGAIDQPFERNVIGEVLAPLIVRGPVGSQGAHVLPEHLRGLEGHQRAALGGLPRPVILRERFRRAPVAPGIRFCVVGFYVAAY